MVRLVLGLILNIVLARALGPATFGDFAFALAMAALVAPLVSLGLERIVVRDLARGDIDAVALVGAVASLRFLGGLTAAGAAVAITAVTRGHDGTTLLVAIIVAGNLFLCADVVDWWLQAREKFQTIVTVRGSVFVLGAATKIALALGGASVHAIAWVMVGETALVAALLLRIGAAAGIRVLARRLRPDLACQLLTAGVSLFVAEIAVALFQRIDIVLLERLGSAHDVGLFASAQRLAQVAFFLPVIFIQVVAPRVARCATDREALALVGDTMDGLALAGYAVTGFLTLTAGFFVPLLFGESFRSAAHLLEILAATNFFVFIGCGHSLYLVNRGHQAITLRLTWITASASVALNLALIPRLGAAGAAWAAVIAYGVTTMLGVTLFGPSRPLLACNLRALVAPLVVPWDWHRARRQR